MLPRLSMIALGVTAWLGAACSPARVSPRGGNRPERPDLGTIEWRGGRVPLRALFDERGSTDPVVESLREQFGDGTLWAGESPGVEPPEPSADRGGERRP